MGQCYGGIFFSQLGFSAPVYVQIGIMLTETNQCTHISQGLFNPFLLMVARYPMECIHCKSTLLFLVTDSQEASSSGNLT